MIEEMYGLVFDEVYVDEYDGSDALIFRNKDVEFRFCHYQDCCETVMIEEIFGDLSDLVGEPLYFLDESSAEEERNERALWTFYKFGTRKGYVDVRWFGESDYYSIDVHLVKTELNK